MLNLEPQWLQFVRQATLNVSTAGPVNLLTPAAAKLSRVALLSWEVCLIFDQVVVNSDFMRFALSVDTHIVYRNKTFGKPAATFYPQPAFIGQHFPHPYLLPEGEDIVVNIEHSFIGATVEMYWRALVYDRGLHLVAGQSLPTTTGPIA